MDPYHNPVLQRNTTTLIEVSCIDAFRDEQFDDASRRHDGKAFGSRQTVCLLLPISVCAKIVTDGKWQWKHAGRLGRKVVQTSENSTRLRPRTRDNGDTRDVELASNTCRLVVD